MNMTAWQEEWLSLRRQESKFLRNGGEKKNSAINSLLEDKVPENLQGTLDAAFCKAFQLIFEKGTAVIEKTYNKEQREKDFKENEQSAEFQGGRHRFRLFSRKANSTSNKNLLLSGVEGIGLGVLGIGLPDIPLFTAVMLRSIYQVAIDYGYEYESEKEKYFILKLIQTALSFGDDLKDGDLAINLFIKEGRMPDDYDRLEQISETSATMSTELLYMKFLQGLPVVGAVGGAYDTVYLQKVLKYAKMKYHRRLLTDTRYDDDPDDIA